MNHNYITLTPINLEKNNERTRNYYYEKEFFEDEANSPRWTDSVYNTSTIGDLFGFVINRKRIQIFVIIDIQEHDKGREHWQEDERKQVLILSKLQLIDSWRKYKKRTGKFGDTGYLRSTTRLIWVSPKFKDEY